MQTLRALRERHEGLKLSAFNEAFGGELRAFEQVFEWLTEFINKLVTQNPARIANSLVQLGLENPHHVDHFGDLDFGESSALGRWFKKYQWQYNTAIWEAIVNQKGLLIKLRRVLNDDLRKTGSSAGMGKIALHAYERALLDYFLQPQVPAWCIAPTWQTPEVLEQLGVKPKLSA